jgi:hypothetical protein
MTSQPQVTAALLPCLSSEISYCIVRGQVECVHACSALSLCFLFPVSSFLRSLNDLISFVVLLVYLCVRVCFCLILSIERTGFFIPLFLLIRFAGLSSFD